MKYYHAVKSVSVAYSAAVVFHDWWHIQEYETWGVYCSPYFCVFQLDDFVMNMIYAWYFSIRQYCIFIQE
jgi:hypothetical protein